MIRHSRSFLFSIIFHGILLIILFFTWKNIPESVKVENKKVRVELCTIVPSVPVKKLIQKSEPKPIPKKVKKTKVKPKPIVKKVRKVKEVPLVAPKVVKEEPIEESIKEPQKEIRLLKAIQTIEKKIIKKDVVAQNPEVEQKRLEKKYLEEHISKIVQLLQENLYYPRRARKRGIVGEVLVKFKLSMDAKAYSIEILSSKSKILSRAAIKTIEDLSGEFPRPSEELILHIPINYSLKR